MKTGRARLPGSPQHEPDRRTISGLRLAGDLEPVTLIERDVLWIGGFEIRRQMIRVNDPEAMLQQVSTETPSLHGSVDAEPRKVPVRESRMGCVHLSEDRKAVRVLRWCDACRGGSNPDNPPN